MEGTKQRTGNPVRRYPVVSFYVLAFAITWLGWIPRAAYLRGSLTFNTPIFDLLSAGGPTLAAVIVMLVLEGRDGPGELFSRLFQWRARFVWYLVALFGEAAMALTAVGLAVLVAGVAVDLSTGIPWGTVPLTFLGFLLSNVWEEIGWRGFALPRLQTRYNALVATLFVGVLWALWHLPLLWRPDHPLGDVSFLVFLVATIALAVVYTWIYNSTGGSLFFVTVFHAAANTAAFVLLESEVMGFVQHYKFRALVLVVVAAAIVAIFGPARLSRQAAPAPAA